MSLSVSKGMNRASSRCLQEASCTARDSAAPELQAEPGVLFDTGAQPLLVLIPATTSGLNDEVWAMNKAVSLGEKGGRRKEWTGWVATEQCESLQYKSMPVSKHR